MLLEEALDISDGHFVVLVFIKVCEDVLNRLWHDLLTAEVPYCLLKLLENQAVVNRRRSHVGLEPLVDTCVAHSELLGQSVKLHRVDPQDRVESC